LSSRRRSEIEYGRRLHAVLDHIDRHLDSKLDLPALASVANFSPFHFHRIFRALTDEALGDYLRRRRLEVAATRLRTQQRVSILQVALGVGFGSAEAFTRAFRARFGCAPSIWRKRKHGQVSRKPGQGPPKGRRHHRLSRKESAMKVNLVDLQPVSVAYLRQIGPYGRETSAFWMKTVAPWMAANGLLGRDRYGVSLDDPAIVAPAQCRYDACVVSPEKEILTGDPGRKVIPGGRYAVLSYEGTSSNIGSAWDAMLSDWLPQSGLQLDSRPFFEHYPADGRFDPKTGAFTCNICLPVASL
jgi:AraC family transcriptional regulator